MLKPNSLSQVGPHPITGRCPHCRSMVNFIYVLQQDIILNVPSENRTRTQFRAGIRRCPDPNCGGIVFIVADVQGKIAQAFPHITLEFDTSDLPDNIRSSMEEAIKCHAIGCYRASALMVRRVLEELCEERQIIGASLKERLNGLKSKVILPNELLAATQELRLLGNDAAHIEAKTYDNIGEQEVSTAIELAQEILKAIYQYNNLLKKLISLKSIS